MCGIVIIKKVLETLRTSFKETFLLGREVHVFKQMIYLTQFLF